MKIEDFLTYIPEGFIYSYDELSDLVIMYQERVSKAIEYIKEYCEIVRFEDEGVDMIGKVEGMPLLNILQGSDNNGM